MQDKASETERAARAAEKDGNWDLAYTLWEKRQKLGSFSPGLKFQLAQAAAYSGRLDQAAALVKGIKADQMPAELLLMLKADIAERQGSHRQALNYRRKAAPLLTSPYWALFGAARAMQFLDGYSPVDVISEMQAALACPGAELQGAMFLAGLLYKEGECDSAIALLERFKVTGEAQETWALNAIPGMTTAAERAAVRDIARSRLQGSGRIVDLGCWLGSLTAAIASGMSENGMIGKKEKVIAYDAFSWIPEYMERDWPGSRHGIKPGGDFLDWFREFTARWSKSIDVRKEDLEKTAWREGKIELLVVDAMKDRPLARHITEAFFPHLLRGAYVVHQDFCHFYTWWIHLYHYRARQKFKLVDNVPGSGTVVFQLVDAFTARDIKDLLATDLSDPSLAREAFEFSLSITDAADHPEILRAYARCEAEHGRHDSAAGIERRIPAG